MKKKILEAIAILLVASFICGLAVLIMTLQTETIKRKADSGYKLWKELHPETTLTREEFGILWSDGSISIHIK